MMIASTGSPDEWEGAERMASLVDSDRCVSMGGRTTLPQLLIA